MAEDERIPFSFQPDRWTEKPPQFTSLSQGEVWRYLRRETDSFRQVNRGWAFKEEGYVRNVRWNASDDSQICLVRAICLPSMKKAPYTVSAWFASGTGRIMGGSCSCVAGLSETCHHIAALLLTAEESCNAGGTSCTDIPCIWAVPPQAKKPAPPQPLADITFCKYLVNRPVREKKRRSYNPCEAVGGASSEQIQALRDGLRIRTPGLLWLEFSGAEEARPARPPLPIADDEDLWSRNARDAVYKHAESLPPLTDEERAEVTRSTIGQADNPRWHEERRGRITASVFSKVIKCVKPEYLVKGILYPSPDSASEAMRYGRMHESDAVAAYEQLMGAQVDCLEVHETGLHIHPVYSFVAASPDRIVIKDGEEGLLEVKCPSSKVGLTPLEACKQDKKFCCEEVGGEIRLKKRHAYYYQVQGQMAVTGHKWCDFVVWTNNKTVARSTHTETIFFDKKFVEGELLPGLLYFAEHALFPEVLTGRIRRRRDLIALGQYVSYKKYCAGFYVVEDGPGLKKKLRKLQ
ncbi:uncharacterized protein LOC115328755 [Ixodes scapularis]|uniref:uncharacterized protein LOC115328755 n=1 Tax=Ixodes scapularis TaxID=6945 RepID=UPI001A9D6D81|nr:uncharacterized protein LOC115328755 [Ixodes scapularis]